MTSTQIYWRAMTEADLPEALAIAEIVHPNYPEDPAVFAERLALYPLGCLLLVQGDRAIGYVVSHPWHYADPPALNSLLGALPSKPSTYYIHDIALLSAARGSGAANAVISRLIAYAEAKKFPNLSLTAVNDSAAFWRRHGFVPTPNPTLDEKLRSYDESARFMVRQCGETRA
jgi:ribosomal protein S18 acetylase RimI-like enzyme